jgi:hypothetical protein
MTRDVGMLFPGWQCFDFGCKLFRGARNIHFYVYMCVHVHYDILRTEAHACVHKALYEQTP